MRQVWAPCVSLFVLATAAAGYYGGRAAEAILTFTGVADVKLANVQLATLNQSGRFRAEALAQIDAQVQHLMGIFQSATFEKQVKSKGTIGETYDVKFTKIEDGSEDGRKLVTYEFRGKTVFDKKIFGSDRRAAIPIKLPLAADKIYRQSSSGSRNPCTDEHYNSEDDFWYFWDPDQTGCGLKGDTRNVIRTEGRLQRLDKLTRPTYPEYDRLFGENGNGKTLDVRIFFGYNDDERILTRPNKRDDAFQAMRLVEADLRRRKFQQVEEIAGFRETATGRMTDGGSILRSFVKTMRYPKATPDSVEVRIQMLLSDTSIGADSRREKPDFTFHHYLIPAFKEADVLLYDGHSGLGANLDLKSLERFRFDREKYQIFFFNGCSTYPYYNGSFFEAKGGRELNNLEVVTTGLPTLSNVSAPNMLAVLNQLLDPKLYTYQTIMRKLEKSNKRSGTFLSAVNGDEDNRFRPK
jgi:hypothetical protein